MPDYPDRRRYKELDEKSQYAGGQNIEEIFPDLLPAEKKIAILYYGLGGKKRHTFEQICALHSDITTSDLHLLFEKIAIMLARMKREKRREIDERPTIADKEEDTEV
ncbi:hypothetical protein HY732_01475 [Candidatus Uhrbacteria bacterium]|nr:hypothetical protein [Candidatus Uhrbacteria bacterium]